MHIYSFPVQQTIIYYLGNDLSLGQMIIMSFMGTVTLAIFSWFMVEKKALSSHTKLF